MKKKITCLFLAAAMTVAGTVTGFAKEEGVAFTGTITAGDLTTKIDLPTAGALTIKPYSGNQISTAKGVKFANKEDAATAAGETQVDYIVAIAGYTSTAVSKDADNAIVYKTAATAMTAYTGNKKEVAMAMEISKPVADGALDTTDEKGWATNFATDAVSEIVAKKSEADYDATKNPAYTKIATPKSVTVKAGEEAGFRVTGTMNANAPWQADDKITVTPIFSVTPSVSEYTAPATS